MIICPTAPNLAISVRGVSTALCRYLPELRMPGQSESSQGGVFSAAVAAVLDLGAAQGQDCAPHAGADSRAGQPGQQRESLRGRSAHCSVLLSRGVCAHRLPLQSRVERKVCPSLCIASTPFPASGMPESASQALSLVDWPSWCHVKSGMRA